MNATEPSSLAIVTLPKIKPGANPRRFFDRKKHDELVAGFRLRGMLQPMLVRPASEDGTYLIVAGERRHRAALEAFGPEGEVPVLIRDMTDQEALEAAIDENDNRDDASETEQADAAVRVLAACHGDRAEAARRLGWSAAKLDRRLALANLSDAAKLALDERRIKVGHAELLAAVPADKQDKALDTILSAGLDVAKTRELLMRVTQNLAAATFDKTECTTCPFNSGTQRALFETHVDDGACTNPGCFTLKLEAVPKPPVVEASAAPPATTPATTTSRSGAPVSRAPAAGAPPKPSTTPAAPKATVTAQSIASQARASREAAWRTALVAAAEGDPEFATTFEACLRGTWQVDRAFLMRFDKGELKFIAQECGLVEHMGAKKFAKLLESKAPDVVAGMLNATGFDWAGRLPGAMTIDGKYSPPPSAAVPPAEAPATTDKD